MKMSVCLFFFALVGIASTYCKTAGFTPQFQNLKNCVSGVWAPALTCGTLKSWLVSPEVPVPVPMSAAPAVRAVAAASAVAAESPPRQMAAPVGCHRIFLQFCWGDFWSFPNEKSTNCEVTVFYGWNPGRSNWAWQSATWFSVFECLLPVQRRPAGCFANLFCQKKITLFFFHIPCLHTEWLKCNIM